MEQADLQLSRTPYALPELVIRRRPPSLFEYEFEDFEFRNYRYHPAIKAPDRRLTVDERSKMTQQRARREPMIEVRHSPIHGYGVFALRRIRKGTTVIEYLGDRVSHDEADTRYEDKLETDNHTFLFTVDSKIVIDAGRNGNEARYHQSRLRPELRKRGRAQARVHQRNPHHPARR